MDELTARTNGRARTPFALTRTSLASLPVDILRPTYALPELSPGIVHIGVGNFHRAHMAWYTHRLMQDGGATDWAILGAGARPYDAVMREKLLAQDCLTTLLQLDPDESRVEVTGTMVHYLPVAEGHAPMIAAMADPRTRIVSMTVTEGGYYCSAEGTLDVDHPDIRHDAAGGPPRTVFGAMVAALRLRRDLGHGAFTGLSCDNLQGNGDVLRLTLVGLAEEQDPDLARWIDDTASFPNSMVDCIVPATGPREIEMVRDKGIWDRAPVTHERFRQWVIEDDFAAGRPDWDAAGATFASDVAPYEHMKLRLLNAGHQILANPGEVLSLPTIADCMADPEISGYFRHVLRTEVAPHVESVPGTTPMDYISTISGRFANPLIHDTVRRVAFDGSSRHPGFVLPTIRDALAVGAPLGGLALVEALWCRMCEGTREDGSTIEPNDPHWEKRHRAALASRDDPRAWIAQVDIYDDLRQSETFTTSFAAHLDRVRSDGARAAIRGYLGANA
ncbi:mannitol dehydrogenase family protein [Jannaschia aquimarina]|uniref:MtlK protein n=1 Tax=Jannaschia aquimarina TaxID=935700 RepID=A0A0D1EDJ9_9RHOB|nr:mannitol dehydrogenase family protein [Jannaschia aquimarina]KIT15769.1 Mannitol 2-dehydrogenase [Jannaschia aquimarina]SNT31753.1 mannitol 2-dehydrogenase [Jannaschia aquimarina]